MQPLGTYVVFGATRAPEVHMLGHAQDLLFAQRLTLARTDKSRADAYRVTFGGAGIEAALPAYSTECMATVAEQYRGPHETALRGLCAAIALGRPYGRDEKGGKDSGGDGGAKVPRKPTKPKSPSPAKASAWSALS